MKKFLIFASLILLATGCSKIGPNQQGYGAPASMPPSQPSQPQTQTYVNGTYGFQFTYPIYMSFVMPNYANLQNKIVQLQISKDQYPKTNFADAGFAVSENYAKSLNDCLSQNPPEGSDGFKTQTDVNGTVFYKTKSSGAGAGNFYQSNVYRSYTGNQTCLEIDETIHTGNIGNYPAGTVTQVNIQDVQSKLDSVLQTFKFSS